jgi:hypothetical protein
MRLTNKTRALAAIATLLAVLVAVALRPGAAPAALPVVSGVVPDDVQRLVIASALERIVLERGSADRASPDHTRWRIVTPLDAPADAEQVRTLLRQFGTGVGLRARMGDGDPKPFGLDTEGAVNVQLFTGAETPALSLDIGRDAGGGATFVRLPGAADVYRADVGGRMRFARPAADWRDKAVLALEPAQVAQLVLHRGGSVLTFTRGPSPGTDKDDVALPGPWTSDRPDLDVDTPTVEALVTSLCRMRAGEIHNPAYEAGFDAPVARAELRMQGGATHTVVLGGRTERTAAFVRVDDRPDVYRVAAPVGRQLAQPDEAFRNRAILSFDPADVASVSLADGGLTIVLEQSADGTGTWSVAQPANMDVDQQAAQELAQLLSALRADALVADPTFQPSGALFTIRFRDGRSATLEVGAGERDADNRPMVRVRASQKGAAGGRVHLVAQSTIAALRRAFGRG